MFEIGMPWNTVMNSKTLNIDSWHKKANWYNGHWGVQDFELEKWLNTKYPSIKQFNVEVRSDVFANKYSLGDIEFRNLDLAFYNDKLVAVFFELDYDTDEQEVLNHYIEKYGEGIGEYYSSKWTNGLTSDDFACDITIKDKRQWKNESVTLQYTLDERHLAYPKKENKRGLYWKNEYFIVFNEQGLSAFEDTLHNAKEEYKGIQQQNHKDALNSL